jgi:Domain of unknown function (DUF4112)
VLAQTDPEIERVRTFVRVFDRYGLDPLLGFLLPGIGDVVGSLFGLYIVGIATRRGLSKIVIARMMLNLGIDALVGVIPLLGDVADFVFKANDKNLKLLETRVPNGAPKASDWAVLVGAVCVFVGAIALVGYALARLIRYVS